MVLQVWSLTDKTFLLDPLKMISAVETLVTDNSYFQNFSRQEDHIRQTNDTPGFKLFTLFLILFHRQPLKLEKWVTT